VIRGEGTSHGRYLRLYETVHKGDDEVDWAFNDLKRSTALIKLGAMARLGLVTDEELARFEPDTRETVRFMLRGGD
jgi:hypothetical protein